MPAAFHVFYGEDEFSIAEALEQLKAGLGPSDALAANTSVLDGRQCSLDQVRLASGAIPFLADHRLVVVEGLLDRFEDGAGRGRGRRGARAAEDRGIGEWAALAELAPSLPPTTTLVVTGGAVRPQNPMLRALERSAQCRRFPAVRAAQTVEWIRRRAQERGGMFANGAARLLADFAGGNLRLLDQEIAKLCTYANGQPITEDTVRRLCHTAREARIFDLMDAVAQRRQRDALRALEQLFAQDTAPQVMLTMLARQVRQMIAAKALTAQNAPRDDFYRALGTNSDFVVDKTVELARTYSMEALKGLMERLLQTDLAIKTGQLSDALALELLVAEASR